LLDSSEGARQIAELQKQYNLDQQNVLDTANGYSTTAQQNVAQAKSQLTSEAQAAEDPNAVGSDITARMPALQALPTFSPIGAVFQNVSDLAAQSANYQQAMNLAQRNGYGGPNGLFNSGASSGGSSRIVSN
jgi:hypothetical protein